MNWMLGFASGLLTLIFLGAGVPKITHTRHDLLLKMAFAEDFSTGFLRLVGTVEVLCALGILFPFYLDVLPVLTPIAAIGLIVLMIGAMAIHLRRGEWANIPVNLILGGLAAVILWARWGVLVAAL